MANYFPAVQQMRKTFLFLLAGQLLLMSGCSPVSHYTVPCDYNSLKSEWATYEQVIEKYQLVLSQYLQEDGRMDFGKLAEDTESRNFLDCYLSFAANIKPDQAGMFDDKNAQLAFTINVYNACALRGVLEFYQLGKGNTLPANFASGWLFSVAGQELSLNQMAEKMEPAKDWRIAFALSLPVLSGPYPAEKVYRGDTLEQQLDEAVKNYLASCAGLQIDYNRQKVLFGELIYQRRNDFVNEYQKRFGTKNVTLLSALVPYARPGTRKQLADVVGFGVDMLHEDYRVHDLDRDEQEPGKEQEEYRLCGCK
jgi:hypothetical protein